MNKKSQKAKIQELQLPADVSSWAGHVNGCQISLRDSLQRKVRKDGSLEDLALIRAVKGLLPCPVTAYQLPERVLLKFYLYGGNFSLKIGNIDGEDSKEIRYFEKNRDQSSSLNHAARIYWVVLQKDGDSGWKGSHLWFNLISDFVLKRQRAETERFKWIRKKLFDRIGYHKFRLPNPTGEPDLRIEPANSTFFIRPITLENLTSEIQEDASVLRVVQEEVERIVQRVRQLYLFGWEQWEFFTVAEHYAVLALETSFRKLYEAWLGRDNVRINASRKEDGTLVELDSPPQYEAIRKLVQKYQLRSVELKGYPFPGSKPKLLDHAVQIGVLTPSECEDGRFLFSLRDNFSHPEDNQVSFKTRAEDHISDAVKLINLTWGRLRGKIPAACEDEESWLQRYLDEVQVPQ